MARLYVNGDEVASSTIGGDLSNWSDTYRLALANELTENRPWLGNYHLAAVFEQALSAEEVNQNYAAGLEGLPIGQPVHRDDDISDSALAEGTQLEANFPNPFNPATTISFELARDSRVELCIFNARGRLVKMLIQDRLPRGSHSVLWTGLDNYGQSVASGVYFYRLRTNDYSAMKKMMLLK